MAPSPAAVEPAPPERAADAHARLPFRHSLLLSLVRIWMGTWRLRWTPGPALPEQGVLVLWHEHLPACIPAFARRRIRVLVSRSGDGSLAAEACRRLGYRVHRGSDTAGALAGMKALARGLRDGGGLAGMALDGPRGPRRVAKPGTLWLAGAAGAAVLPIAVKASWALRLKTWDRCLLPLPFSRVEIRVGEPCRPADAKSLIAAMEGNQALLDRA
jgi:lysophospholipid acyltransferase (LPLAT)-like uncharacterized protein